MLRNGKVTVLTLVMLGVAGCAQDHMGLRQHQSLWYPVKPQAMAKASRADEPKILPETYFAAARLFEQQGAINRAIAQYRKAIAVNHKYVAAYHRLGMLLNATGQHDEATKMLRRAVALKPDNVILRNNLGFSLMLQQRWAEAEREFRQAAEDQPSFVRAHINLGIVLATMERFDEALTSFQNALPEPDAHYNLGLMFRAQKRYDEAAEAFRQVLALDADFSAARAQLHSIAEHLTPSTTAGIADISIREAGTPAGMGSPSKTKAKTMAATVISEPPTVTPPRRAKARLERQTDPRAEERTLEAESDKPIATPKKERSITPIPMEPVGVADPVTTYPTDDKAIIPALRVAMERARMLPITGETGLELDFELYENVLTVSDEETLATVLVPASTNQAEPMFETLALATRIEPVTEVGPSAEIEAYTEVERYARIGPTCEAEPFGKTAAREGPTPVDSVAVMDAFDRLVDYFPGDVWCWDGVDWEAWETVDVVKLAEAEMVAMNNAGLADLDGLTNAVKVETSPTRTPARGMVLYSEKWLERNRVADARRATPKAPVRPADELRRRETLASKIVTPADNRATLRSLETELAEVREEIQCWDELLGDYEYYFAEVGSTLPESGEPITGQPANATPVLPRDTEAAGIITSPFIDLEAEMAQPVPPVDPVDLEVWTDDCPSVFDASAFWLGAAGVDDHKITGKVKQPTTSSK